MNFKTFILTISIASNAICASEIVFKYPAGEEIHFQGNECIIDGYAGTEEVVVSSNALGVMHITTEGSLSPINKYTTLIASKSLTVFTGIDARIEYSNVESTRDDIGAYISAATLNGFLTSRGVPIRVKDLVSSVIAIDIKSDSSAATKTTEEELVGSVKPLFLDLED